MRAAAVKVRVPISRALERVVLACDRSLREARREEAAVAGRTIVAGGILFALGVAFGAFLASW